MPDGVRSTNLPSAPVVDEVLGHRTLGDGVKQTVRVPATTLATLLAGSAPVASVIADAQAAAAIATAAAAQAAAAAVTYSAASWAQLAAITPTMIGQRAVVSDVDAGTHTGRTAASPGANVSGVLNAGAYGAYALTAGAWRRDGDAGDEQIDNIARAVVLTPPAPRVRLVSDRGMVLADLLPGQGAPSLPGGEAWTGLAARSVTQMPRWRKALARMAQGLGNARILGIGDSNMMGWYAGPSGQHLREFSWPSVATKILDRIIGAEAASWFGNSLTSTTPASVEAYDPRRSLPGGWVFGGASIGGNVAENATTTNPLTFNPGIIWDKAIIWVGQDAAANITVGIGGAVTNYSPTPSVLDLIEYTATRGANTLRIGRTSGRAQILGVHCYDSLTPRISFLNAGRSGWRSTDWSDASFFRRPLPCIEMVAPDLGIIALGLNDFNQQLSPAAMKTELTAIVNSVKKSGDAMLVISSPPDDRTMSIKWTAYTDAIRGVAAEYDLVVVDLGTRYRSYTDAVRNDFAYDGLHPGIYGYGDCARLMADILLKF